MTPDLSAVDLPNRIAETEQKGPPPRGPFGVLHSDTPAHPQACAQADVGAPLQLARVLHADVPDAA